MQIVLDHCLLRSFRASDAESLARYANNRLVWRNVRDQFPHPYTLKDARQFIARMRDEPREVVFAIEVEGEAVGSIGVRLKDDIERFNAEVGYWLGEPFWGQGLMTEVVRAFVPYALKEYSVQRLEAWVFEWNPASARVLEKAGFSREGTLRKSALKDGQVIDRWLYAYLATEPQIVAQAPASATNFADSVPGLVQVRD
jgi:ribosomal-protein-alanine N-acetyltransferase